MGSSSKKQKKDRDSKRHKRHRSRSLEQRIVRETVVDRDRQNQRNRSASKSPLAHSSNEFSRRSTTSNRPKEQDRDKRPFRKHKERNRSRSRSPHRTNEKSNKRGIDSANDLYDSDSSDCVEVPLAPPAPVISKQQPDIPSVPTPPPINRIQTERSSSSRHQRPRSPEIFKDSGEKSKDRSHPESSSSQSKYPKRSRARSPPSPEPENGAGDCLSIEETNKLRAKLGMKPLEVESCEVVSTDKNKNSNNTNNDKSLHGLSSYKDEWGEFLHKPANNIARKDKEEKIREKLKQSKEKRALENRLKSVKGLGESDEEVDDLNKWVSRSKAKTEQHKEAAKKAKMFEELDEELGADNAQEKSRKSKHHDYRSSNLKGLRVEHDYENFTEGRSVILTLKDKGVLDEDDDALINVNMIDDERYKKNVENKKKLPQTYGYDVYQETYDQFGDPIERNVLSKYDEELEKGVAKNTFIIGTSAQLEIEQKRRLLEIKTKLSGKKLETLQDTVSSLAKDTYTELEMAKFRKPKKKIKKIRQKLKAEDLIPIASSTGSSDFGSRRGARHRETSPAANNSDDGTNLSDVKFDIEDDLQKYLSKARKVKQQEALINKSLNIDPVELKHEIKSEEMQGIDDETGGMKDSHIVLNATAEFCRTLGDIPTYGMAGNRDEDSNDAMDYENEPYEQEKKIDEHINSGGTWNSVNPNLQAGMDDEGLSNDIADVAILDEEPDVGAGVAAALQLALSKGYLEKDDLNRPSNAKMSHLQAKNYTIDDKAYGEEDKQFNRRDRYHGPISEFHDKDNFKPNVKLDYIDDNGRILNAKEAFRYLSHKFHGKGPGKNKIEKRLKKMEQEGLMKTMSSTDTPLGTLTMLQQKQKDTQTPYVVLSGGKQAQITTTSTISKQK